ncbi:MAG: type II toxin-antitoxin system RelE family toxin [Actinomycetota bacterium]
MSRFEVRLSSSAERAYTSLQPSERARIRRTLLDLAAQMSERGRGRGKKVKTIRGTADSFHRLRVGDYPVMYDVIERDRVLLVLGIVHRRDLERWLRGRRPAPQRPP